MWYLAKSLQNRALKGAATCSHRTFDLSYSLPCQVWEYKVVFLGFCGTFERSSLFPLLSMKVKTCILFVCSNIAVMLFLSLSQRCYQIVVSLSVLPDSLATEHRWVYSSSLTMARPLALKPLKEIPYWSFTGKQPESPSRFAVEQLSKYRSGQIDSENRK